MDLPYLKREELLVLGFTPSPTLPLEGGESHSFPSEGEGQDGVHLHERP